MGTEFNPKDWLRENDEAEPVPTPSPPTESFNPKAWLDENESSEEIPKYEVAARAGLQGLTSKFGDEGIGHLKTIYEKMGGSDEPYWPSYERNKAEYNKGNLAAKKQDPALYNSSEMGGAVLQQAHPIFRFAGKLGPAGSALYGAAQGLVSGLGETEGKSASEIMDDLLKSGSAGLAGGFGGHYLGKGLEKGVKAIGDSRAVKWLSDKARDKAIRASERAMGAERGTIKKYGQDKISEVAEYGLDNGIVRPFSSADKMISRNEAVQNVGKNEITGVEDILDSAGIYNFNPQSTANFTKEQLSPKWRSPIHKSAWNQLDNTIETIAMRGKKNIPLADARALRSELGDVANWKKNPVDLTPKERIAQTAYHLVNQKMDEAIEMGAKELGVDGLLEIFKGANRKVHLSMIADDLLGNVNARESGNKAVGLTDWILGSNMAAETVRSGGNPAAAVASVAAKKGMEKYGWSTAASGMNKISQMLKTNPERLGKFASSLSQAAQRGSQALSANIFILQQQNPEFREFYRALENEEVEQDDQGEEQRER